MWAEDVRLQFGLELVLQYSCMDGSREAAGPKLFTPTDCGLRSYQWWDQSGPSAGKSPSSCRVGHYSCGAYSQVYGGWTNQVSLAGAGERPICFLPSLSLAYTPVYQPRQREETCLWLFKVSLEMPQPKAGAKSEKVHQRARCNEPHVELVWWSAAKVVAACPSEE